MATADDLDPDLGTIQQMATGDASALAALYDRHAAAVYSLAVATLEAPVDAEAVVQDVFAQAWRQAARYDAAHDTVSLWLVTMARGRAVDRLRARTGLPPAEAPAHALEAQAVSALASGPLRAVPADLKARVLVVTGAAAPAGPAMRPAASAPAAPRPRATPAARWPLVVALAAAVALLAWGLQARSRVEALETHLAETATRLAGAEADAQGAQARLSRGQAEAAVLSAPDLRPIDLSGAPGAAATARAFWSRAHGLVVTASRLPDLLRGQTYQVWVLNAGAPVSAGLFSPDAEGRAVAVFDTPVSLPAPTGVAVSIEAAGGVTAPTGAFVLQGMLASAK